MLSVCAWGGGYRSLSDSAEVARKLWEYLIKQEEVREMFIHNLYSDKVRTSSVLLRTLNSVAPPLPPADHQQ